MKRHSMKRKKAERVGVRRSLETNTSAGLGVCSVTYSRRAEKIAEQSELILIKEYNNLSTTVEIKPDDQSVTVL